MMINNNLVEPSLKMAFFKDCTLTWNDENVAVFVTIISTMTGCAIANGESGSLVANQLEIKSHSLLLATDEF